ncbi:MAG: hypothetical protein QGG64_11380, partial [Candidatus Latescibacteria bacterium]|nr:hypothetical protein [Candidatus Latescibacterota bacterium]
MRFSRWFMIMLMGAILCAMGLEDIYAQRGGGRGRGGGGGGGGGNLDVRPGRRGQYDDYPWDAQKLLESNSQILRQLPAPIQAYVLDLAKKWDDLFPIRQQQIELFFRKIPNTDRQEFSEVFGNVLSEFQGLQGGGGRGGGRRGQGNQGGGGGPEAGA